MIKENENIVDWERNLYSAIKDIADIEFQKKAWLGEHPDYVSSFSEVISILYDDFDFERFLEYLESTKREEKLYKLLMELDNLINQYKPLSTDEEILVDPNWLHITSKAQEICILKIEKD